MDIQQYWFIVKRRWLPASAVFASVSVLTLVALTQQTNIYQAAGKIRYTPDDRTSALTGLGVTEGGLSPLVESSNPMTTEMEVIRSEPIVQETLRRLTAITPSEDEITRQTLLRNLSLTNVRGTDILLLTYQDAEPELAATVIDTLMEVYLANHVSENRAEAMAAREFIERELPDAEARVREAEAALRQFQESNQVAALEEEKVVVVTATETLRQRVAEARSALVDAQEQAQTFSQQLGMSPQQAIALTTLSQSPGVQEILTQYQEVESQLAVERVRFQDESPVVQALLDRQANLEQVLQGRVTKALNGQAIAPNLNLQIGELQAELAGDLARTEAMRRGLAQQLSTLQQAQTFYAQRLAMLPRLEQEQRELLRRLEAVQGTYSLLLERLHETRIAENQNVGNARILQAAFVGETPVAPRKLSFLATGGIVALLLAAATALVLESQDKYVKTAKQARNLFELTLLGVVPMHKTVSRSRYGFRSVERGSEVIVRDEPESAIAEAYRMLQANLRFLNSDREIKTVVITSATVGEGKSVISANLAMARAQLGRRVLLIDADMRCPRQHQIWNIVNDRGLSNVMAEHCSLASVVKSPAENLDVLTAGVIPPNPTALLDSQRLADFLQDVAADYDFVVLDTPAINIAADVQILGRLASGVLLVTRPGVVDLGSALAAKERLAQFGSQVLGQVINGVVLEHEPDSYRYFAGHHTEWSGTEVVAANAMRS
ncbi:GumC family protein [Halomicronema sp. CCY15110]|uniref:GumC family protein n=1 Tax=Halomicronema sp. CCY15110 TaxID=2767773 RepID=UPI001951F2AD|nr:polysaccharide biosynthesis tyrosine autokinase [Halomicronema sp. CCY15110]